MSENKSQQSKSYWVGLFAISVASVFSLVLAGPKLGMWASLPGCGPKSGCDAITNGAWGNIPIGSFLWPVSFVGFAWFVGIFSLWGVVGGTSKSLLWIIRLGVLGSLGFVVVMISTGHFCKYCAVVHICNVVLWVCAELQIRSSDTVCKNCFEKRFLFWFSLMSVVLGGVYMFASANKKASDERAGDENTKHIIEGGADHSTLKLLESDHRFGSPDAAIQVVMFTDYQCPDCKRLETQLARIYEERSDLSIVVKHFPLNFDCNDEIGSMKMHGNACWAARAAEAAYILDGSDGWARMHTWLFENKGSFTQETFSSDLQVLGFDPQSFVSIMMGDVTLQNVKSDAKEGKALGIWFTPMIFINGVEYLWYYGGQGSLARVIGAVSDAIASGNVSKVAPPLALEKLIEDWRVGRTHGFQEHERLSWSGRGDVEIVVWGDYQTDPTRVINATIKEVLNEDSRAKYSFRHFPIDAACNRGVTKYKKQYPGSCNIAKVVEAVDLLCGDEARWKVHDAFLVSQPSTDLASLAKIASSVCDSDEDIIISVAQSQDVEKIIHSDIQSKLSVWRRSVPVLVIDGRFVPRWEMGGMTGKETILKMVDEASQ